MGNRFPFIAQMQLLLLVFIYSIKTTKCITTTHHDKPEGAHIPRMVSKMQPPPRLNGSSSLLSIQERQKRLLPYANFYVDLSNNHIYSKPNFAADHNNYQQHQQQLGRGVGEKFTPFLESNALPGPFTPIALHNHQVGVAVKQTKPLPTQRIKVEYVSFNRQQPPSPSPLLTPVPISHQQQQLSYSAIYDKLAQLKLNQQSRRLPHPTAYIQLNPVDLGGGAKGKHPTQIKYKPVIQPTKTFIETFTATNIDIPPPPPPSSPKNYYIVQAPAQNHHPPLAKKPIIILTSPAPNVKQPHGKPIILLSRNKLFVPVQRKPQPLAIVDENYIAQNYPQTPNSHHEEQGQDLLISEAPPINYDSYQSTPQPQQEHEVNINENLINKYQQPIPQDYYITTVSPEPQQQQPDVLPNPNMNLAEILKHLQRTNTLPQTLTPDNIDNSIKTLVRILEALKKQQKLKNPIVVDDYDNGDNHEIVDEEIYPADTPDGGTPGKAGVDYPALSTIPPTRFNCKTQRYKGFFGDPDTNCQVWHYCDLNGGQASFLCPNGTIFSQVALTCDWWYNVKCATTPQLYVLNERLYKYILPLAPKFPEDYSGPLVDKYLALKFQEMEEKMAKEKKGKGNSKIIHEAVKEEENPNDDDDNDDGFTEKDIVVPDVDYQSVSKEEDVRRTDNKDNQHATTLQNIEDDNNKGDSTKKR